MELNLRPLTLSEILDRTAQLYRANFLLFAGIAAVYAGVLLLLSLLQISAQEMLRSFHLVSQLGLVTGVSILLFWLAIFVFGGLAVAANNRAVAWVHLGHPATIRGAYTSILPRLGRYLWLMAITSFVIWTPAVLLYAGYAAFLFLYARPRGVLSQAAGRVNPPDLFLFLGVTLVFGLLLLGAIAYAVLMGLRYSLAVPACVVEDLPARRAIRRSIQLSHGSRARIFVLGLLAFVIQIGLVMVTQTAFLVVGFRHHGELSAGVRVLQQLVTFCTNTFVAPIYATGLTLFYYDQRVRKEGYDIEWMMQAAGLASPQPDPAAAESAPLNPGQPEGAHE